MGLDGNDVREQVAALESEVLNDEVERVIGVLDAGDGNVSDLRQINIQLLAMSDSTQKKLTKNEMRHT